jgi:hypothetical protein
MCEESVCIHKMNYTPTNTYLSNVRNQFKYKPDSFINHNFFKTYLFSYIRTIGIARAASLCPIQIKKFVVVRPAIVAQKF